MGEGMVALVALAALVALLWVVRESAKRQEASFDRERAALERLLAMADARELMTPGEARELVDPVPEDIVAPNRTRTPDEVEWLSQWEDQAVRLRWAHFLDRRIGEGRTPNEALADAEMALVAGRESLLTDGGSGVVRVERG